MSLTVDVLETNPLPMVRLVVADVPAGRAWRVLGVAGEQEWVAGQGVSAGDEIVFSDPLAPLGVEAGYVLVYTSEDAPADLDEVGFGNLAFGEGPFGGSLVATRHYAGQSVITDLSGRVAVDLLWAKDGGDSREWSPRANFADVGGSPLPVGSYAPVAGAGTGALSARTIMPHTATFRGLVQANRPLVLLHNHGRRCRLVECDVPLARIVMFTSVSEALSSRMDRAERIWSLSYRLVPRPWRWLAPVATWEDVRLNWSTNAELAASGLSNADLVRGDWLVS